MTEQEQRITQEQLYKIIRIAFTVGQGWGSCYQGHFIPTDEDTEEKIQACIQEIERGKENRS